MASSTSCRVAGSLSGIRVSKGNSPAQEIRGTRVSGEPQRNRANEKVRRADEMCHGRRVSDRFPAAVMSRQPIARRAWRHGARRDEEAHARLVATALRDVDREQTVCVHRSQQELARAERRSRAVVAAPPIRSATEVAEHVVSDDGIGELISENRVYLLLRR